MWGHFCSYRVSAVFFSWFGLRVSFLHDFSAAWFLLLRRLLRLTWVSICSCWSGGMPLVWFIGAVSVVLIFCERFPWIFSWKFQEVLTRSFLWRRFPGFPSFYFFLVMVGEKCLKICLKSEEHPDFFFWLSFFSDE